MVSSAVATVAAHRVRVRDRSGGSGGVLGCDRGCAQRRDLDGLESVGALGGGVDWADEVAGLALCAFGAIPAAELKDWVFGPLDDEEDEADDE